MVETRGRRRSRSDLSSGVASADMPAAVSGTEACSASNPTRKTSPQAATRPVSQKGSSEKKSATREEIRAEHAATEQIPGDPHTDMADPATGKNNSEQQPDASTTLTNVSKQCVDKTASKPQEATIPSASNQGKTGKKKPKTKKMAPPRQPQNELTKILPGYTAPMKLSSSSLDAYRTGAGLRQTTSTTTTTGSTIRLAPPAFSSAVASFKTGKRVKPAVNDAGAGWFAMRATPITEEIKQDLQLIRNRNYLDPKRFYKSADAFGSFVQAGTVIEGAAEYYSARLTKKQRKATLVQEVMADPIVATYAQNKYRKMQQEKTAAAQKRRRGHGGGGGRISKKGRK